MWCSFVTQELKLLSVSVLGVSSPVNTQAQWAEHEACFINFYGFIFCRHGGGYSCFSGCKSYKVMHAQNFWWYGLLFFNTIEHILLHYIFPLQIYLKKNVLINFLQLSCRYNGQVVSRQWTGYRILRGLLLFKLKTWGHSSRVTLCEVKPGTSDNYAGGDLAKEILWERPALAVRTGNCSWCLCYHHWWTTYKNSVH